MYGGRWNRKGTSVLHTAKNRSLATVEYLVHLPISLLPADVYIAEIAIPSGIEQEQLRVNDLPPEWAECPAPFALKEIGEDWIRRNKTLLLKAPSAVVRGEWNILVNPNHRLFGSVTIVRAEACIKPRDYGFDKDLCRQSLTDSPG